MALDKIEIPTLETERLLLRPFQIEDVARLHDIVRQPGVLNYFPRRDPPTRGAVANWVRSYLAHWQQHGFGLWALQETGSRAFVGRCGLQHLPETDEVEIDFLLGQPHWGRGYATEAGEAALEFARQYCSLGQLVGIVHPENRASQRVLEKLEFVLTGTSFYFGMEVVRYVRQISSSCWCYGQDHAE